VSKFFAVGHVRVGHDDAGAGDKESRACLIQSFQINHRGLGLADQFFERELRLNADISGGRGGNDITREGLRNGFEFNMKMIRFQQLVLAAVPALQRHPVHGAFGHLDLFGNVAFQSESRHHRMLKAGAESGSRSVKVAAGKVFLKRRRSFGHAIDFNLRSGRRARDCEGVRSGVCRTNRQKREEGKAKEQAGSHAMTSPESWTPSKCITVQSFSYISIYELAEGIAFFW
jgi:hypothetical protein